MIERLILASDMVLITWCQIYFRKHVHDILIMYSVECYMIEMLLKCGRYEMNSMCEEYYPWLIRSV